MLLVLNNVRGEMSRCASLIESSERVTSQQLWVCTQAACCLSLGIQVILWLRAWPVRCPMGLCLPKDGLSPLQTVHSRCQEGLWRRQTLCGMLAKKLTDDCYHGAFRKHYVG